MTCKNYLLTTFLLLTVATGSDGDVLERLSHMIAPVRTERRRAESHLLGASNFGCSTTLDCPLGGRWQCQHNICVQGCVGLKHPCAPVCPDHTEKCWDESVDMERHDQCGCHLGQVPVLGNGQVPVLGNGPLPPTLGATSGCSWIGFMCWPVTCKDYGNHDCRSHRRLEDESHSLGASLGCSTDLDCPLGGHWTCQHNICVESNPLGASLFGCVTDSDCLGGICKHNVCSAQLNKRLGHHYGYGSEATQSISYQALVAPAPETHAASNQPLGAGWCLAPKKACANVCPNPRAACYDSSSNEIPSFQCGCQRPVLGNDLGASVGCSTDLDCPLGGHWTCQHNVCVQELGASFGCKTDLDCPLGARWTCQGSICTEK